MSSTWSIAGVALLAAWLAVVWFSPLLLAREREPLYRWMVPGSVSYVARSRGVEIWLANCATEGYAFSCYLGLRKAIVVDTTFYRFAPQAAVEFVLAHELGHIVLGHVWKRPLMRAFGLGLLPGSSYVIQRQEHEANVYAEKLTGMPRSVVWGVGLRAAPRGPGFSAEEREVP